MNPGPGSFRLLAMLGRLGVAGVEPLSIALGLSMGATYSHLRRLEKAGLVWRVLLGDGGGGAVAISRAGAARVRDEGLPAIAAKSQAPSSGVHARAVSWVAAGFELRDGYEWRGPAELRQERYWRMQRDDGAYHYADLGLLHRGGTRIAIEVELHYKSLDRLRVILRGYRHQIEYERQLHMVAYVTGKAAVERLVRREAADAFLDKHFEHTALDKLIAGVRRGGRR